MFFSCIRHLSVFILVQYSICMTVSQFICPFYLSMGMWITLPSWELVWGPCCSNHYYFYHFCWDIPRNTAAQSQDMCMFSSAGTTAEFSKVTTRLALPERVSSAPHIFGSTPNIKTSRKSSGHHVVKFPPLLPFPEASGRTTHLKSIYVGFFTFTVKSHTLTFPGFES